MAEGSRCIGLVLEMGPLLPIAPILAYPNCLNLLYFDDNYTLLRIFMYSIPQLLEN
jgi:hypothetical protein